MKTAEEIARELSLEERKVVALEKIAEALELAQSYPNMGFYTRETS